MRGFPDFPLKVKDANPRPNLRDLKPTFLRRMGESRNTSREDGDMGVEPLLSPSFKYFSNDAVN